MIEQKLTDEAVRSDKAQNLTFAKQYIARCNILARQGYEPVRHQVTQTGWYRIIKMQNYCSGRLALDTNWGNVAPVSTTVEVVFTHENIAVTQQCLTLLANALSSTSAFKKVRLTKSGCIDVYVQTTGTYVNFTFEPSYVYETYATTYYNWELQDDELAEDTLVLDLTNNGVNTTGDIYVKGEKVYSPLNPPPLYLHYFNITVANFYLGLSFTILSPKSELLTNAEILSMLPSNTSDANTFGLPAAGKLYDAGGVTLLAVEKISRYNGFIMVGAYTDVGSWTYKYLTTNLASDTYQKVIPLY